MSETYVAKFNNGDAMRDYLRTLAKLGDYVIYYNRLHRVIDCGEQGLGIAVCKEVQGE